MWPAIKKYFSEATILQIAIWCVVPFHLFLSYDAITSFGIGVSAVEHAREAWVLALTFTWVACAWGNRFAYYAYIFASIVSFIFPVFGLVKNVVDFKFVFHALLPLNLAFAALLILDLMRVILLAHKKRKAINEA